MIDLARFARVELCHRPTPLEPMRRLSELLGGPQLFVKRDDCTGLAIGGNKTRKLEFLMADALARGANTVITVGGVQSNHCRQTAAAAARLGLQCELVLPHISRYGTPTYETNGNLLLDQLLGAALHLVPGDGTDRSIAQPVVEDVIAQVKARGDVPYFIPPGGSSPIGALGYVDAACELARQAKERHLRIDHIVVTTGSTTTHAGLLVGLEGVRRMPELNCDPVVHGISVYQRREAATATVREKVSATAELLGIDGAAIQQRVMVTDDYLGGGYGEPTAGMFEAAKLAARCEGLLVDPVYTGKTLAGLIDMVRQGRFDKDENVVFLHTGGTPALFAYREAFADDLAPAAEPAR